MATSRATRNGWRAARPLPVSPSASAAAPLSRPLAARRPRCPPPGPSIHTRRCPALHLATRRRLDSRPASGHGQPAPGANDLTCPDPTPHNTCPAPRLLSPLPPACLQHSIARIAIPITHLHPAHALHSPSPSPSPSHAARRTPRTAPRRAVRASHACPQHHLQPRLRQCICACCSTIACDGALSASLATTSVPFARAECAAIDDTTRPTSATATFLNPPRGTFINNNFASGNQPARQPRAA